MTLSAREFQNYEHMPVLIGEEMYEINLTGFFVTFSGRAVTGSCLRL